MQVVKHKKSIVVITFVALFLVLGFWWNAISARLAVEAKGLLLNQINQSLNGKMEIGSIGISLSKIAIRQVSIFDVQGVELGKCNRIVMSYGFWDFLHGRIGIEAVKEITVEGPALALVQGKDGRFNIASLFKPESEVPEGKEKYRGPISIVNGTATITTAAAMVSLENIKAVLTLEEPALQIQQGMLLYGGQRVAVKGRMDELTSAVKFNLEFAAKDFDSTALGAELPLKAKCSVNGKVEGNAASPSVTGSFEAPDGILSTIHFNGAKGGFQYVGGVLSLDQVAASVFGGNVQLGGTINIAEPQLLKLYVNVYGLDSARLADDIAMQGIGNYYTIVEGTANKPVISGKFEIAQGLIRNVPFTEVKGGFRVTDMMLYIEQATAAALGGNIAFSGTVQLSGPGGYQIRTTGHELDLTKLIAASQPPNVKSAPPAISGAVSLQATITGATVVNSAEGTFTMPSGVYADNVFTSASGNFRYDGKKLIFDNARVNMGGGVVSGNGTLGIEQDEYVLSIAGTGLDSGQLTSKQVQSKLAFDANAKGAGDFDKAVVHGSFRMGSGTVSGIPFSSAQGNFTRQNGQYHFDAVNFEMLGGLVKGDIVMKGSDFEVKINTPSGTVAATEKQLLDKLLPDLPKGTEKLIPVKPPENSPPTNNVPSPTPGTLTDLLKKMQKK